MGNKHLASDYPQYSREILTSDNGDSLITASTDKVKRYGEKIPLTTMLGHEGYNSLENETPTIADTNNQKASRKLLCDLPTRRVRRNFSTEHFSQLYWNASKKRTKGELYLTYYRKQEAINKDRNELRMNLMKL